MRKRQKEAILISFFKEKEKYEKLAEYIVHLIGDDPSLPRESLHTITYRIKNEASLIEKIDRENKTLRVDETPISKKNYQERIWDLAGIRFICLRLSDIKIVEAYLELLAEEKILRFIQRQDHLRSFVLPIDSGEVIPEALELPYSGYSSIHYKVELGENSKAVDEFAGLQAELQLRTILEEAWCEIDQKYRYGLSRSGVTLPDYIHTGFYDLSVYLQTAALRAEHLCQEVEALSLLRTRNAKEKSATPVGIEPSSHRTGVSEPGQVMVPPLLQAELEANFGFKLSTRTLMYIKKRLLEVGYGEQPKAIFQKLLTEDRLHAFRTIYYEVLKREPFKDNSERDLDAINAINFSIFDESQGRRVTQEGLRSVLRWRRRHSR